MTTEQYNRAVEIYHQIKSLARTKHTIQCLPNDSNYEFKLSFIEHRKSAGPKNWNISDDMDAIQDILDKHEKMIRQEIEYKIKMLNQEIEKL